MAAMLQIPRVFPCVFCLGSAKVVQCPCSGPKIGDKSQPIPRYSPVCLRGQSPWMAADKCITLTASVSRLARAKHLRGCSSSFLLQLILYKAPGHLLGGDPLISSQLSESRNYFLSNLSSYQAFGRPDQSCPVVFSPIKRSPKFYERQWPIRVQNIFHSHKDLKLLRKK